MQTRLIEATNIGGGGWNHGKFLVGRFDRERDVPRAIGGVPGMPTPLIPSLGWSPDHLLVLDLATGEGALFRPGGSAEADLRRRKIWCCPLFPPFLEWLYRQDLRDLDLLPPLVNLDDAPSALRGRRHGEDRPEAAPAAPDA